MNGFVLLGRHGHEDVVAVGEGGTRNAREFLSDVTRVASRLRGAAGPVLLVCKERYHLALGAVAAWHVGVSVSLPPNGRDGTLADLAASVSLSVGDDDSADVNVRACLDDTQPPAEPTRLLPIAPEQQLATIYTSGSTAAHQACHKSALQLLGEAQSLAQTFGFGSHTCMLATVPAHHIYGLLFGVLVPMLSGGRFVRETPLHARVIEQSARRSGATTLISVPAHLHALTQAPREVLGSIAEIFSSGAPLPASDAQRLHEVFGTSVHEVLGSTETGGFAHRRSDRPDARWRALPGVTIGANPDGRMQLSSPLLDPSTAQPLVCADRIELASDGSFRHLGRADGVVKVGGTRVSISELEARVLSLPNVSDAAALGIDVDNARGQELWLAVAADGVTTAHLRASLLAWYEPVALPRRLRVLPRLPREATGKLPRAVLLGLFDRANGVGLREFDVLERRVQSSDPGRAIRVVLLRVPAELVFFEGHFPGHPLLPGVVQLEALVLEEVERLWPGLCSLREITRLKFKQPILPGDELELELERHAPGLRVDFVIRRAAEICAQGSLAFQTGAA